MVKRKHKGFYPFPAPEGDVKRNIAIIYATSALMWGRFFVPVLALFYVASQVTLPQFGIIMAVFALTTLILEIPSGIAADLLGKRRTLIIARACYLAEVILLAFTNGFWPLLIAKVISGVGVSMSSGTNSALLYDTLRRSFKEHKHLEIKGTQETITYVSQAVFFITGAWLFTLSPKLPAKLSLIPLGLGLLLTFFLKEPYKPNRHLVFATFGRHLGESVSYLKRHRYVRYLVFYAMPLTAAITILLSLSSAYFKEISIPVWFIGIVAFAMSLATAYAASRAHKLEKQLGERLSLRIIPVALIIATLLLALTLPYVGVIFYILLVLTQGFLIVIIDNYVNKHIETSHRTTMLSIKNLFASLAVVLLFPLIGRLTGVSMGVAYAILAAVVAAYMAGFFVLFTRRSY